MLKKKILFSDVFFKFFLKKGKIVNAEIIFKKIFKEIFEKTKLGQYSILLKLFKILYSNFELRKIKKYRSSHIVIIPIKKNRRYFLILKYLFDAIKQDKRRVSISTKLSTEIIKCVKTTESEAIRLKNLTKDLIAQNRSNVHYRWY